MHKLFYIDLLLVMLTILGVAFLYEGNTYPLNLLIMTFASYVFSKIFGYFLLPYRQFEEFINDLTNHSKVYNISGYEIFKSTLVVLLYLGFLFLHPAVWIIESILVIVMRLWGKMYLIKKNSY